MDSPSISLTPLEDERLRKAAPSLLMCLCWLYGLHMATGATRRTYDFKDELMMTMRASELAIADATGMQPETRQ